MQLQNYFNCNLHTLIKIQGRISLTVVNKKTTDVIWFISVDRRFWDILKDLHFIKWKLEQISGN